MFKRQIMKRNERDNFVRLSLRFRIGNDWILDKIRGEGMEEKYSRERDAKRNWKRNDKKRKKESMIGKNRNHDGIRGTRRHEADM